VTLPRRLLKQQVHLVTRRTSERRFFLKPCKAVRQVVLYALGLALQRYAIQLYALVVEANHFHMVLCDPKGELDAFMKDVDQLIARALNAYWGRGESFWSPSSYSNVEIHDPETLIRKLVYVFTNPVRDGLVARPEDWPGIRTLPEDMGSLEFTVQRPKQAFFGGKRPADWIPRGALSPFEVRKAEAKKRRDARQARAEGKRPRRERSRLPKEVTFSVGVPSGVDDRGAFVAEVRNTLEAELQRIYTQRAQDNKPPFMGAQAMRDLDHNASAGDTFPQFRLNPRLAPGSNEDGQAKELKRELSLWRMQYAAALLSWRSGRRNAVFPVGTCRMVKLHGCRVGEVALLGT